MKNNKDNVYDHTSNNFDGIIALTTPTDSWVAKWQRLGRKLYIFFANVFKRNFFQLGLHEASMPYPYQAHCHSLHCAT